MSSFLRKLLFPPVPDNPNTRPSLRYFIFFLAQAILAGFALNNYHIEEGNGLAQLAPGLCAAAVMHYWIPQWMRAAFFTLLCWMLILQGIGPVSGLLLIALIAGMTGIAHLKIRYTIRIGLIVLITAFLIALRLQVFYFPRIMIIVPMAGSILMFRMILYLYERKYEKPGSTITYWQRLSYFFNPLNVVAPLFPIIDFKTWTRCQYDAPQHEIYQKGFRRILFGFSHLLLYRFLYQRLPNPATIATTSELVSYIVIGYLLVIRMTGLFWILIGMIGIFGYNLPPVFNNVFFISSFGDIWRRINIYWRDFVTKVFYYPVWFRLRKKTKQAVLLSSLIAFVITWLLHGWQWFWVRGDFSFKTTDTLYWLGLGFFISISLAIQEKKQQSAVPEMPSLQRSVLAVLRIFAMFTVMSLMWSFWNSATVHEWLFLMSKGRNGSMSSVLSMAGIAGLIFIAAVGIHYIDSKRPDAFRKIQEPKPALSVAVVLFFLGIAVLGQWKGAKKILPENFTALAASVQQFRLNQHDRENAEQGYYEKLLDNTGGRSPWEIHLKHPSAREGIDAVSRETDNLLQREMVPGAKADIGGIYSVSINRWGMRDQDYPKEKAAGTFRIALLGGSYEMGVGVNDGETFEQLIENRLNADSSLLCPPEIRRIEILNFGAGGYHLPQQTWLCDHKIFDFHPDLVLYVAHSEDGRRLNGFLASLIQNGIPLEYNFLNRVKNESGAKQWMSRDEIRNRLQPYDDSVSFLCLRHIAQACIDHHSAFAMAYLPALGDPAHPEEETTVQQLLGSVRNSFAAGDRHYVEANIFSLAHTWDGLERRPLEVSDEDTHPNAKGHRIIADALYKPLFSYFSALCANRSDWKPIY